VATGRRREALPPNPRNTTPLTGVQVPGIPKRSTQSATNSALARKVRPPSGSPSPRHQRSWSLMWPQPPTTLLSAHSTCTCRDAPSMSNQVPLARGSPSSTDSEHSKHVPLTTSPALSHDSFQHLRRLHTGDPSERSILETQQHPCSCRGVVFLGFESYALCATPSISKAALRAAFLENIASSSSFAMLVTTSRAPSSHIRPTTSF
jgi:hypothetical protein